MAALIAGVILIGLSAAGSSLSAALWRLGAAPTAAASSAPGNGNGGPNGNGPAG